MPDLSPVVGDPFAGPVLAPVSGDPFAGQPSPFDQSPPTFADSPFASSGTLSSYEPSSADRLRVDASQGLQGLGASRGYADNFGAGLANVVSNSPLGAGMQAQDASRDFGQGNYTGGGLNAGASALAIFAGPMSRTADIAALDLAKGMAAKGAEQEAIRDATGWFTGADGKWRYEISDHAASLAPNGMADIDAGKTGLLPDVLEHKELYDAYPQLRYTQVSAIPKRMRARTAGDMLGSSRMRLDPGGEDVLKTALHETQHGVQDIEGFGKGAAVSQSPLALTPELEKTWANLKAIKGVAADIVRTDPNYLSNPRYQAIQDLVERIVPDFEAKARYEGYRRLMGETEARNVEDRSWMTPKVRADISPKLTQDYPDEMQLQPTGAGGAAASAPEPKPGIIAYHGSPHSFDQFDLSKIGTGEGAQAYGHGLYFAENEGIAKSYRDQMRGQGVQLRSTIENALPDKSFTQSDLGAIYSAAMNGNKDPISAAREVQGRLPHLRDGSFMGPPTPNQTKLADAITELRQQAQGSMYQVQIAANPDHFLDWDKPLSEQHPVVQDAIKTNATSSSDPSLLGPIRRHAQALEAGNYDSIPGDTAYKLVGGYANPAEASQKLREAGIPGIKYLDNDSRGSISQIDAVKRSIAIADKWAKNDPEANKAADALRKELSDLQASQSRNYVMFSDKNINILKKYGIGGLVAGAGGAAALGQGDQAQAHQLTPVSGNPFEGP